ncbi:unnamed protein product [Lactuca saligna]|uniref:Uncharacterized protein n=1 Tax=Lactuca saligna TaxID=75948 RepID=A0AA35ZL13_LACSI|nr:unnamed protein product [Lactuca saligna]
MFDVLHVHQEVSNIDLYLEVEDIDQIRHIEMESRNHELVVLEEQRKNELQLPNTNHVNAISDMIHNEDFYTISQAIVVSNGIISDNEIDEEDDIGEEYDEDDGVDITQEHEPPHVDRGETSFDNNHQVPLTFTNIEETNVISDGNWTVSQSISKNDFTQELEKYSFKDKEELMRAIQLQCIKTHRQFEVVNEHGSPWLEPRGFHRYCLRHFINNFNDKFHNSELKALAYRAGSQNQVRKFNFIMEEIGKLNPQARQWLERHPLDRWALAHDGGRRYGLLTTNLSDIFNSVLKGARFLPITTCVQLTFYRLVHYFEVRRPLGSSAQANGDAYTPQVVVKQVALMSKASAHSLRSFNREKGIFELITQRGKNVQVVNLDKKTCTCEYCSTWASEFSPLPHEPYWPQSSSRQLHPNIELLRNKKCHPRSTRLRNGMDIKEGKNGYLCGIC